MRIDADAPAGDLVNTADVTTPNELITTDNHGTATTTVGFAGLGDFVWWDQNHDGLQTAGEPGFAGVTVHLYTSGGVLAGTTTTDASGYYRFDHLHPNTTYSVCLDAPADSAPGGPLAGFELTGANTGADDAIDSDAALVNGAPCIATAPTGAAGSFIPTYDFGFWKPAAIGDRVWIDTDHNGIQDAGEVGVPGVGVTLHDSTGATVCHTVTDANGLYLFDRLNPGTYHVCFDVAHDPRRLRADDAERERLDAGQRLGRRQRRLRRQHGARAGPARPRLGRRHLEDADGRHVAGTRPASRSSR